MQQTENGLGMIQNSNNLQGSYQFPQGSGGGAAILSSGAAGGPAGNMSHYLAAMQQSQQNPMVGMADLHHFNQAISNFNNRN